MIVSESCLRRFSRDWGSGIKYWRRERYAEREKVEYKKQTDVCMTT